MVVAMRAGDDTDYIVSMVAIRCGECSSPGHRTDDALDCSAMHSETIAKATVALSDDLLLYAIWDGFGCVDAGF